MIENPFRRRTASPRRYRLLPPDCDLTLGAVSHWLWSERRRGWQRDHASDRDAHARHLLRLRAAFARERRARGGMA